MVLTCRSPGWKPARIMTRTRSFFVAEHHSFPHRGQRGGGGGGWGNQCSLNYWWSRRSSHFTVQFVMSYPALSRECVSLCRGEWACVIQTAPQTGSGGGWGCAERLRGFMKAACGAAELLWNAELNLNNKLCVVDVLCFPFRHAVSGVVQRVWLFDFPAPISL